MKMQKTICVLVLELVCSVMAGAQTRQFTSEGIEYVLELPSPSWQVVSRSDLHEHPEFINLRKLPHA